MLVAPLSGQMGHWRIELLRLKSFDWLDGCEQEIEQNLLDSRTRLKGTVHKLGYLKKKSVYS